MKNTLRNFFRKKFGHGSVEYWDHIIQLEGFGLRVDAEMKEVPSHYKDHLNITTYQVDIRGDGFDHVYIDPDFGELKDRREKHFFHYSTTEEGTFWCQYTIHRRERHHLPLGINTSFRIAWNDIMSASDDELLKVKTKCTCRTPGEMDRKSTYPYCDDICTPHIEVLNKLRMEEK